jgi:DNA-binding transcriptional MocR family regulator
VAAEATMRGNLQATTQMPPPLMVALVTQWLRTGVADQIIAAIRNEAAGRQRLAGRLLKELTFASRPTSHHLWLALPRHWGCFDFLSHALRRGLAVVGSDEFAVGGAVAKAVRVSLGAARNRAELAQALQFLAAALKSSGPARQIV